MRNNKVYMMVIMAMFIALVTVATYIGVPWPLASGGYMHLGTLVLYVIAIAYGKEYGAVAGGVGMMIFDLNSPYSEWAIGTLVVRAAMGYVVGLIAEDRKNESQGTSNIRNIIAFIAGGVVLTTGYYFFEAIFLTTFEKAFTSIPGNLVQLTLGAFALVLVPVFKKIEDLQLKRDY